VNKPVENLRVLVSLAGARSGAVCFVRAARLRTTLVPVHEGLRLLPQHGRRRAAIGRASACCGPAGRLQRNLVCVRPGRLMQFAASGSRLRCLPGGGCPGWRGRRFDAPGRSPAAALLPEFFVANRGWVPLLQIFGGVS
jgi:hypothetical protein